MTIDYLRQLDTIPHWETTHVVTMAHCCVCLIVCYTGQLAELTNTRPPSGPGSGNRLSPCSLKMEEPNG